VGSPLCAKHRKQLAAGHSTSVLPPAFLHLQIIWASQYGKYQQEKKERLEREAQEKKGKGRR